VRAQRGGAPSQEKAGAFLFVGEQDDRDGGGTAAVRGYRVARESGKILSNARSERLVESA
jgi:hypothetical protein